jgi:hypothetical protein
VSSAKKILVESTVINIYAVEPESRVDHPYKGLKRFLSFCVAEGSKKKSRNGVENKPLQH